jgi:hypothetical protein
MYCRPGFRPTQLSKVTKRLILQQKKIKLFSWGYYNVYDYIMYGSETRFLTQSHGNRLPG